MSLGQMEALEIIYKNTRQEDLVLGNMNMNTWCIQHVVRKDYPIGTQPDNLLFGLDMSLCTATACGLAQALPHRKVISVDGDGAILMKLAVLADTAKANPSNLVIIVIDNESYGGRSSEPTLSGSVVNLLKIAEGSGIKNTVQVQTASELESEYRNALKRDELTFIVVKVELKPEEIKKGFDERYWVDVEWKSAFIRNIERTEGVTLITKIKIDEYD